VVVELSSLGEKEENVSVLAASVRRIVGKPVEVFVPAVSQKGVGEFNTTFYMDGYAFVEFKPDINYLKLRETTYFRDVLCASGSKNTDPKYSLIDDKELNPVRAGMDEFKKRPFEVGDPVVVVQGFHKNLRGLVSLIYEEDDRVQINISHLDSKRLLMDFPMTFLEKISSTDG
jgi:transcription antitermination factor NusG